VFKKILIGLIGVVVVIAIVGLLLPEKWGSPNPRFSWSPTDP